MERVVSKGVRPGVGAAARRRVAWLGLVLSLASSAHAADVEYVGQGTRALGRGGAFAARADDPMALGYNPAALADLPDTQLMLNAQNAFYDACVTRDGTYGAQADSKGTTDRFGDLNSYANVPFPRVCQNNHVNPGLWLAGSTRINDRLGIGYGILTPASAAHLIWGDGKGATKDGNFPSPVRYQLVEQDIKLFNLSFGAGYRVADWLRLGATLQWGMALVKNVNYTVNYGTENALEDTRTELNAKDLFIPAAILSAHIVPVDSLDVVLNGRYTGDIDSGNHAKVDVTPYDFQDPNHRVAAPQSNDHSRLRAPLASNMGLSLRYADRRIARVNGERGDALTAERWDIELDTVYVFTSHWDAIRIDIPTLPMIAEQGVHTALPHKWKDQVSLRLGGDWNVLPGKLAVRAGAHYESSALNGSYMGIDFQPAQRLGLHTGLTFRTGRWDLSLAYAHIFQETVTVPKTAAAYPQVAAADLTSSKVVNAGKYQAHYDVVSLGATYRFTSSL